MNTDQNKIGLLTKYEKTHAMIRTSFGEEFIFALKTKHKSLKGVVFFDPEYPSNFRFFKYTVSDWLKVMEDQILCSKDKSVSPLFLITLISNHSLFDINNFELALNHVYNCLTSSIKFLNLSEIWKLTYYASKGRQIEVANVLNKYNPIFNPSQEKPIIYEAIKYCEELINQNSQVFPANYKNIGEHSIFQKFIIFQNIIQKVGFSNSDKTPNKLIQLIKWKYGKTDDLDFETLKTFFYCFSNSSRWAIIKKLVIEIEESNRKVTTDELVSLIESNNAIKSISDKYYAENITKTFLGIELLVYGLDSYSKTGKFLSQGKIIDILNSIKERKSKINLQLNRLFDYCNGGHFQVWEYKKPSDLSEGDKPVYSPLDAFYRIPERVNLLCNGRLSPTKDDFLKREYQWCYGKRCFRSAIFENDYYKIKFIDFCRAFGYDVYQKTGCGIVPNDELSRFIDTLSKVSSITDRLYCESCGQLLFPESRSDKQFVNSYNRFSCQNENCSQKGVQIYLSHCHTSNCRGVIDSRHLKKCPNGMHICPECFGCCSDKFYQKQNEIRGITSSQITVSHNDKGIFYCYKCGDKLVDNKCPKCKVEHKDFKKYKYSWS